MVKSYQRYAQCAGFGVTTSGLAACPPIRNASRLPLALVAAADALHVRNLRSGALHRVLSNAAARAAGPISAVAVSADALLLAAGHADGSIRVWPLPAAAPAPALHPFALGPQPAPAAVLDAHRAAVTALAFAPDAALVSAAADGDVVVWDVADARGVCRFPAHTAPVVAVAPFDARAARYVASAARDGLLRVFHRDAQCCVQTLAGHRGELADLAIHGPVLVSAGVDADLRVYLIDEQPPPNQEPVDPQHVLTFVGAVQRYRASERVASLAFGTSGGETFLAVAAADKSAEVFRLRGRKAAEKHQARRRKRALEAAEKKARAEADDLRLEEPQLEANIAAARKDVEEGNKLEAKDFLVSVRQITTKDKLRSVSFLLENHQIPVTRTASHNVQLLMQTKSNALEVYRAEVGTKKRKRRTAAVDGHDDDDNHAGADSLEKLVTVDAAGHRKDIRSVSLATDDRTLLSAGKSAVKLWNIDTQRCIRTIKNDKYALCSAFITADASRAAVGSKDGTLAVYDLGSGATITAADAHDGALWDLCLDNHVYDAASLITCGADKRVCFWALDDLLVGDGAELKLVRTLEMPDEVLSVRVSSGSDRPVLLASLMDSTVRAFFLDSLEPYLTFYGHKLPVMAMDVSSDGKILVTGSADKTIKLWGMDFGDCRRSLRAHRDSVLSVAFQPNTHYIFSGSRDGTVKYWDGDKFEFICELEGQRGEAWDLAVSDGGKMVVSASHDRMLRVWRETDEPIFLEEEKDRRMDEMFESTLIDEDRREASKAKKPLGFIDTVEEVTTAGKRSLSTIKAGERLLEALDLCDAEQLRLVEDPSERPSPLLLGLSADAYLLRTMEGIKMSELDEALTVLPLSSAVNLLEYCARLLAPDNKAAALAVELVSRIVMFLLQLHNSQIVAGATTRKLVAELHDRMAQRLEALRSDMGFNAAALSFWKSELADRDDAPFRDAEARAFNIQMSKKRKLAPLAFAR